MPAWLLKLFHMIGMTNLTDEDVARYVAAKKRVEMTCLKITFTHALIVEENEPPSIASGKQLSLAVTTQGDY